MIDRSEQGGAALVLAILALLLVPTAYVLAHPHPMGLRAWVAAHTLAASATPAGPVIAVSQVRTG